MNQKIVPITPAKQIALNPEQGLRLLSLSAKWEQKAEKLMLRGDNNSFMRALEARCCARELREFLQHQF